MTTAQAFAESATSFTGTANINHSDDLIVQQNMTIGNITRRGPDNCDINFDWDSVNSNCAIVSGFVPAKIAGYFTSKNEITVTDRTLTSKPEGANEDAFSWAGNGDGASFADLYTDENGYTVLKIKPEITAIKSNAKDGTYVYTWTFSRAN